MLEQPTQDLGLRRLPLVAGHGGEVPGHCLDAV
jgi:hypothetical protein